MPQSRRAPIAALVATGVTAALMVAALVTYFLVRDDSPAPEQPTFSTSERAALSAAATEMANLQTYRRAHFAADFARALTGVTGSAKADIQKDKAQLLKTITSGKFDLSAKVLHVALAEKVDKAGKQPGGYVVLVSLNGYRSTQVNLPTQQNLQVTVVQQGGKWLVNDVRTIGVS